MDFRTASVIPLYLMVGKIQLWVHYLSIPYGMENPVVGLGTKKPHVAGVWLELFPVWKYQDSSFVARAFAIS